MIKLICKILKCVLIILIINMLIILNNSVAVDFTMADDFINAGKTAMSNGEGGMDTDSLNAIGSEFSQIGSILTYIGAGILVGATAYMGILYLISPPDKQAALKQQLIGLVVAGIVIFGAYAIWKGVLGIVQKFD